MQCGRCLQTILQNACTLLSCYMASHKWKQQSFLFSHFSLCNGSFFTIPCSLFILASLIPGSISSLRLHNLNKSSSQPQNEGASLHITITSRAWKEAWWCQLNKLVIMQTYHWHPSHFNPEDGNSIFLRNADNAAPFNRVVIPSRRKSQEYLLQSVFRCNLCATLQCEFSGLCLNRLFQVGTYKSIYNQ